VAVTLLHYSENSDTVALVTLSYSAETA